ncbi:MAG: ABC transporter permease [Bacilli bacterium]|nr:ABC transporter permease [Bacilli bacterium]
MNKILIVLKKELKETFRDKKSLMMMMIMPIIIPIFIIIMGYLFESESAESVKDFNKIGFNYEFTEKEKELAKQYYIDPVVLDESELQKEFEEGTIKIYMIKEGNVYTLHYKDNASTAISYQLVTSMYYDYKIELQKEYLTNYGINSEEVLDIITFEEEVPKEDSFIANYLTKIAFVYIVMAITIAATYPATDATAGEKERGTLETLFTFPIKSRDIVVGKYLSVTISSAITGLLSLFLSELALIYIDKNIPMIHSYHVVFSFGTLLFMTLVVILISLLISGLTIAMASRSKSFKEAQSALSPLNFIVMLPGMYAMFTEAKSTLVTSIIPFVNIHFIFDDVISGKYNMFYVFVMILSTIIFIVAILSLIIKQYKREETLFS